MGKPSASTYKPTTGEITEAKISLDKNNYYREKILPVQLELRDQAETQDLTSIAEGRASADIYQTLTGDENLNIGVIRGVDTAADRAVAAGGSMIDAFTTGKAAELGDKISVASSASKGRAIDAKALSAVTKLDLSDTLSRSKAKQTRQSALFNAAAKITSFIGSKRGEYQALKKAGEETGEDLTGGGFFNFLTSGPTGAGIKFLFSGSGLGGSRSGGGGGGGGAS